MVVFVIGSGIYGDEQVCDFENYFFKDKESMFTKNVNSRVLSVAIQVSPVAKTCASTNSPPCTTPASGPSR